MALNGGFMGLCEVDDLKIRVTDFNVNVKQDVQFYDHIIGLRDSFPSGLNTKGEIGPFNPVIGGINYQKYFWRPGVKIVSGSFSFPATVANLQKTFNLARTGDAFSLKFNYACNDIERLFDSCTVNSFSFSSTAGDVVNIQVDVMGRSIEEGLGSNHYDLAEKLLTWDQLKITSASNDPVQMFSFTVNNSCSPIYTAGNNLSDDLFPQAIRVGMQEVTGTIVYYIKGIDYIDLNSFTTNRSINIKIDSDCNIINDFDETLYVIYKPIERASNLKALLHTLPFVGVGQALGEP